MVKQLKVCRILVHKAAVTQTAEEGRAELAHCYILMLFLLEWLNK